MKDFWKTLRLAAYVFALPLVATAAVSAHQFFQQDDTVSTVVVTPKTVESKESELVGLNGTFRQHTIANDENGQITGRVWFVDTESKEKAGLADTKVYFVRDGEVISQVYTDPDGTFDVKGLENGAYSFVVSNTEGVAVYGVNVVETADASSMEVVIVSKNATVAQKLIDENNAAVEEAVLADETVNGSNVAQLVEGELEGRLHSVYQDVDLTNASVKVYDASNKLVAETTANAEGQYVLTGLETGYYELVASGTQGYAAFGFEAVEANEAYTSTAFQVFDTTLSSPVDSYYVSDCATCGGDIVYGETSTPVEYAAGCTSCSGAFSSCGSCQAAAPAASSCGGCGGGGGFGSRLFGGRGGLGGILGLTGFALGLSSVIDDGDALGDGGVIPSDDPDPVDPATPSTLDDASSVSGTIF